MTKSSQSCSADVGAVFVEAVAVITLFAFMALAFAQQYSVVMAQLRHQTLATEIMLGPQERSLALEEASGAISPLCDGGASPCGSVATTPTLTEYRNEIGNFIQSRLDDETTVAVQIAYLEIQPWNFASGADNSDVGKIIGSQDAGGAAVYRSGKNAASKCTDSIMTSTLATYSTDVRNRMVNYRIPGQSSPNDEPKVGIKLYSVELGGSTYEDFIEYLPIGVMAICTETDDYVFPQTAISTFPLVPTRLTR